MFKRAVPNFGLFLGSLAIVLVAVTTMLPQSPANRSPVVKNLFFDSDGTQISNNEFVDIRMANFHLPDQTLMKTLEDGTVEFRLQKVPQEGMALPEMSVTTIDGDVITAADVKGKVVVLNFWFIGCPVCLNHKPYLNELRAKFADNENVVFIAMTDDAASAVKKFVDKEGFDYLHAANAGVAMKKFGFTGYPKNIVISRTGEIVYWRSTVRAWDRFESVIRGEIAKN